MSTFNNIVTFLSDNKQPLTSNTRWNPISWENKSKAIHAKYLTLVKLTYGDKPIEELAKALSIAYTEYKIAHLNSLDTTVPDCIMEPLTKNLANLQKGKGKQSYMSTLLKMSHKICN